MRTLTVTADPLMRPLKLRYGTGEDFAEGICIAVSTGPQVLVETATGERIWWKADLSSVDGEELTPAQLDAFRAKQPKRVTIDPEDPEQVERLAKAYDDEARAYVIEQSYLQAALREFANPTPPKPEEPTGLGAVVEAADGRKWIRAAHIRHGWHCPMNKWAAYADIDVARVLSEGVSA